MKNFLRGMAIIIWIAATLGVVRFLAPALISSTDTIAVIAGFFALVIWILGSACYGYSIFKKPTATPTKE